MAKCGGNDGCGRTWKGKRECHCKACHEHFTSDFAFDKHWIGVGKDRHCISISDMKDKGMAYNSVKSIWSSAQNERFTIDSRTLKALKTKKGTQGRGKEAKG